MSEFDTSVMEQEMPEQFVQVLSVMSDSTKVAAFLRDVMTEKEIQEISARFEAAKMLTAGESYTKVIARTKLSSRTVARISDWLRNGTGGYVAAFEALEMTHLLPDSSV